MLEVQQANHPDDPSNPHGNCYSGQRDDLGFVLKLIQHAKTVAINIGAELIRHDDMPSDDKEDYHRAAPQWLLRDIARAKDAHFARGRKLKDHCIDKLDAAMALMGVVIDRSKSDGNTVTLETDAPTINFRQLKLDIWNDIFDDARQRGQCDESLNTWCDKLTDKILKHIGVENVD